MVMSKHKGISKGYVRPDGYKAVNVNGKKILEHRAIWKYYHGDIPDGYQIHHIDGNKLNNNINNLELISSHQHPKKHRKYNYLYVKSLRTKGFTLQQIADKIGVNSTGLIHYILETQK